MKRMIIKSVAFALAALCLLSQFAAFAVSPDIIRTYSNTEFAVQTAKIIGEYESANDISAENCRVIGRALNLSFDFEKFGAKKTVIGNDGRFLLQFNNEYSAQNCLDSLNSDPDIAYAEHDGIISVCSDETETEKSNLSWGVEAIEADKYSEYISSLELERTVTVAVIDSGVANIEFLSGKTVPGYDFVDGDSDPSNDESIDSHGTFIASIIADCVKDAPVKIMPVRVLSSENAQIMNVINGIYYAVDNGAQVLNISMGGNLPSNACRAFDEALAYAQSKNASVVVSAGNNDVNTKNYCPAHNASAITVTSVWKDLSFASGWSNYGNEVDLCAPGMEIIGYSASGNLKEMSGTSMAAGFVSASAALFRLEHPECNASQVQDALKNSCADLGSEGFDIYYGFGIPQLGKFIDGKTDYSPRVVSLSVVSPPQKTVYTYKSGGEIELDGLVLEAIYSDSSRKTLTADDGITASGFSTSSVGEKTVTVEYGGCTASFNVRVEYAWWQRIIRILLLGFLWY